MKKTRMIRVLLLGMYCMPFAFLSVYGDAVSGTMLYYGIMIAGFALMCLAALKTNSVLIVCVGNVLSAASSWGTVRLVGLEPMGYYFKPFTSHSLIAGISVAVIAVHAVVLLICAVKKKQRHQA